MTALGPAASFAVGDTVRVKRARRHDTFVVREITLDGRIRARNSRGEAIYVADAFEHVRNKDGSATDAPSP